MIGQIPGIVLVGVLAVLFGWLATWSARAKNVLARWLGLVVTGLLTIVFTLVAVVALIGVYKLGTPRANPVSTVNVTPSPAKLAQAQKALILCAGCHSSTGELPLAGGSTSMLGGLAGLYPPNLTPGGPLKGWSDGEVIRAIREGVDKDGRPLLIMPADTLHNLSDEDVAATVAALRTQPAVQHETPPRSMSLLATALIGAGLFPTAAQPPITAPVVAPAPAVDTANGLYLVNTSGCRGCHGADLAGIKPGSSPGGGPPPGPNLTTVVPKWTEAQFLLTIHTGTDPTGYQLNPATMPWKEFSVAYTDDQLKAIYAYLQTLTPIQK